MTKYRHKLDAIEAVQFDGSEESAMKISEVLDMYQDAWDYSTEGMILRTLGGNILASKGDWIIRGVAGEFYPCKLDIFEETYELVESDQKHVCGPYIDVDVVAHRCIKCGETLIYEDNVSTDKLKFIGTLEALE